MSGEVTCTCSQWQEEEDHDWECHLYDDDGFFTGHLNWDPVEKKLVPSPKADVLDALGYRDDRHPWSDDDEWEWQEGGISWRDDGNGIVEAGFDAVVVDTTTTYQCDCRPEKKWYCAVCKCERKGDTDPWGPIQPSKFVQKCRHYEFELEFPDGTYVYPSSCFERKDEDAAPDFGLYLDGMWKPACLNYYLGWRDFGLPPHDEVAYQAIINVWVMAQEGKWVEVGCIGGHGRTGTVLACMAVLAGVPVDESVKWVRENYCKEAVETESQEWWVEWFAARHFGYEAPPMPVPAPKQHGGATSFGYGFAPIANQYFTTTKESK